MPWQGALERRLEGFPGIGCSIMEGASLGGSSMPLPSREYEPELLGLEYEPK